MRELKEGKWKRKAGDRERVRAMELVDIKRLEKQDIKDGPVKTTKVSEEG